MENLKEYDITTNLLCIQKDKIHLILNFILFGVYMSGVFVLIKKLNGELPSRSYKIIYFYIIA